MPVKEVLDNIVERYPDVIGVLACHDNKIYHNLQSPYDMVSARSIMDTFSEIFELTVVLSEEGYEFSEFIIDFDSHSFVIRVIDGGLLVLLAGEMQRAQLVKLKVGLNLFAKSVVDAIVSAPSSEIALAPETAPAPAPAPVPEEPAIDPTENAKFGAGPAAPSGGLGLGGLIGRLKQKAGVSTAAPEPEAVPESPPIGPDGKPMKMRRYRGQVYYE